MDSGLKILIDPLYAPCLSYWALLIKANDILIESKAHYQKGSYRNRCHIYGANGLLRLTVPLRHGKDQHAGMDAVKISYDHPWQSLHWESIAIAYRSSPFFEFYEDDLADLYQHHVDDLCTFNLKIMNRISNLIGLELNVSRTSSYVDHYGDDVLDLRDAFQPNVKKDLSRHLIEIQPYRQVFSPRLGFISDLSIYDLLFHKGPASVEYLEKEIMVDLDGFKDQFLGR